MSKKSIFYSILSIVLIVGLLLGAVFLFSFNVVLGIIGIIVWLVVPGLLRTKALNAASGVADKVLAKYIAPILAAILGVGAVLYVIFTSII